MVSLMSLLRFVERNRRGRWRAKWVCERKNFWSSIWKVTELVKEWVKKRERVEVSSQTVGERKIVVGNERRLKNRENEEMRSCAGKSAGPHCKPAMLNIPTYTVQHLCPDFSLQHLFIIFVQSIPSTKNPFPLSTRSLLASESMHECAW